MGVRQRRPHHLPRHQGLCHHRRQDSAGSGGVEERTWHQAVRYFPDAGTETVATVKRATVAATATVTVTLATPTTSTPEIAGWMFLRPGRDLRWKPSLTMIQHIPGNQRWRRGGPATGPPARSSTSPVRRDHQRGSSAQRYITENHSRSHAAGQALCGLDADHQSGLPSRAGGRGGILGTHHRSGHFEVDRRNPRLASSWADFASMTPSRKRRELFRLAALSPHSRGRTARGPRDCQLLRQADPMQRVTAAGQIAMPGHVGTCYQSTGARLPRCGAVAPRAPRCSTPRAGSFPSVPGPSCATTRRARSTPTPSWIAAGAPRRRMGESGRDYVDRATKEGPFRRVKHPGNPLLHLGQAPARPGTSRRTSRRLLSTPKAWSTLVSPPSR